MSDHPAAAARFRDAMEYLSSFTDWEQLLHQAPERVTFDLGRIERLLARFGDPHRGRPVVHVTGTKGKTTVTWLADAILRAHGLRTFRFVSPHVERIHERLSAGGREIDDGTFVGLVDRLRPEIDRIAETAPADLPSFFEITAVMGFLWARDLGVDALVVEVGLGGRLDATNVVDPAVSVITSVGLDHTRILGATREAIATEKSGIVKRGRPVLCGLAPGDPAFEVIAARAAALGCPLAWPGNGFEAGAAEFRRREDGGPEILFGGRAGGVALDGLVLRAGAAHQALNAILAAAAAAEVLRGRGRALDPARVREALAGVPLPGRAEWFPGPPPVLLDGAHTAESVEDLGAVARRLAAGRPIHLLCGLTRDRDPAAVFAPLRSRVVSVVAAALPTPRTRPPEEVLSAFPDSAPPAAAIPSIPEALALIRERASATGGLVLVAGSLYLAGAVRSLMIRCL